MVTFWMEVGSDHSLEPCFNRQFPAMVQNAGALEGMQPKGGWIFFQNHQESNLICLQSMPTEVWERAGTCTSQIRVNLEAAPEATVPFWEKSLSSVPLEQCQVALTLS